MNRALSHSNRYPNARKTSIAQKALEDATAEKLRAELARANRQKRIDAIKRVLRWPAYVWRW